MSDDLDRALERLLRDESPRAELERLDAEQREMVRIAQLLRGSRDAEMRPEFAESLYARLHASGGRVSRRTAFISGIGALAAGILAGVGLDRFTRGGPSSGQQALIDGHGKWFTVVALADLPEGAIKPFNAGAVQGFLIHRQGNVRALSRICTHMGCRLEFAGDEQAFTCPCHGAEFDLKGRVRYGPHGYSQKLAPLPPIQTRVSDGKVQVWSV